MELNKYKYTINKLNNTIENKDNKYNKLVKLLDNTFNKNNTYCLIHALQSGKLNFKKLKYNNEISNNKITDIFITDTNFGNIDNNFRPFITNDILIKLGKDFFKYMKLNYNIDYNEEKCGYDFYKLYKLCNLYHWNNQYRINNDFVNYLIKKYDNKNFFTWNFFKKF